MIKCARYRIVPTEEEYKKLYPHETYFTYSELGDVVFSTDNSVVYPIYTNSLEDYWGYSFGSFVPTKPPMAIYDNRNKGWVLCSIQSQDLSEEA